MNRLCQHSDEINGTVTVGTGATACIHFTSPLTTATAAGPSPAEGGVRTGNTSDIVRGVEENRIDIGLVTLPATGKNLSIIPLGTDEFVVIMEKDASEPSAKIWNPGALLPLPLIIFEPGSGTRALIDQWFRETGHIACPVMELGSIEAIKEWSVPVLATALFPECPLHALRKDRGSIFTL